MTQEPKPYVTFSQRTGLEPIPPQLKLGEVSPELRRLIDYYLGLEISRNSHFGYEGRYFAKGWHRVATDLHVIHFGQPAETFPQGVHDNQSRLSAIVLRLNHIGRVFDLVEFLVRHPGCSAEFKQDISNAFVGARAAYRIFDNQYIAAIGVNEQAAAFERAIAESETRNAGAARRHLIAAGVALRDGDWPGSVRESINAVESAAKRLASDASTLGDALKELEKRGQLHGRLKAALDKLYAYSNADENGARHALVYDDVSQVDEADALFMLGACAAFVTFLLAKGG